MRVEWSLSLAARTWAVKLPVITASAGATSGEAIDVIEHAGIESTSSVAVTETETATIFPFAGQMKYGDALKLLITGAVVSAGTYTAVAAQLELPELSVQTAFNAYVRPPTARTDAVFTPVAAKSPSGALLLLVMDPRRHDGGSPESSVAATEIVTVTIWFSGGQIVAGVALRFVKTGPVVSGGTTSFADACAAWPAASTHVTKKE